MTSTLENGGRRRFVKAATGGLAGLTALAGCGATTDSGEESQSEVPSLVYMNNPPSYNPARNDGITLIGERLSEVGFDVSVEVFEWGTLYSRVTEEHDFDLATWRAGMGTDPGSTLVERFHSRNTDAGNYLGYENAEVDELLEEQIELPDGEERVERIREIQERLADDCPYNPIIQYPFLMAYNNEQVSGWVHHPRTYNRYYNMTTIEVDNDRGELIGVWPESIGSISPVGPDGAKTTYNVDVLYDKLVRVDEDRNPDPELGLATDWTRPDETTVEYTIRDHVWHDGEPLTAEDVTFTINYLKDKRVARFLPQTQMVDRAETVDERTTRVVFNEGEAPGPVHSLFSIYLPIIPKHIWEDVDDPENRPVEEPVGSGPLKFDYWDEGSELSLVRNEDHFRGVNFDRRIWRIVPQTSTTWELLNRGDVNYLPLTNLGSTLDRNLENEAISLESGPGTGTWHLSINCRRDGLDRVAVRKAMVNAIPKTEISEQLLYGLAEPGTHIVSSAYGRYSNPEIPTYEEGVEAARTRLEDAGYTWDDDGTLQFPAE